MSHGVGKKNKHKKQKTKTNKNKKTKDQMMLFWSTCAKFLCGNSSLCV